MLSHHVERAAPSPPKACHSVGVGGHAARAYLTALLGDLSFLCRRSRTSSLIGGGPDGRQALTECACRVLSGRARL